MYLRGLIFDYISSKSFCNYRWSQVDKGGRQVLSVRVRLGVAQFMVLCSAENHLRFGQLTLTKWYNYCLLYIN